MLCVIVFAHIPPSVCVSVYFQQQVHEYAHVCSHGDRRALSAETDHHMMADHRKIGLIFHTYPSMEIYKTFMPFSEVAPPSFF